MTFVMMKWRNIAVTRYAVSAENHIGLTIIGQPLNADLFVIFTFGKQVG